MSGDKVMFLLSGIAWRCLYQQVFDTHLLLCLVKVDIHPSPNSLALKSIYKHMQSAPIVPLCWNENLVLPHAGGLLQKSYYCPLSNCYTYTSNKIAWLRTKLMNPWLLTSPLRGEGPALRSYAQKIVTPTCFNRSSRFLYHKKAYLFCFPTVPTT